MKVIDYKTGNTSFDLLALYHGLQLQLMVYLDGALQVEKKKVSGSRDRSGRCVLLQCEGSYDTGEDPCGYGKHQ